MDLLNQALRSAVKPAEDRLSALAAKAAPIPKCRDCTSTCYGVCRQRAVEAMEQKMRRVRGEQV